MEGCSYPLDPARSLFVMLDFRLDCLLLINDAVLNKNKRFCESREICLVLTSQFCISEARQFNEMEFAPS